MAKKENQAAIDGANEYLKSIIGGIDSTESTDWSNETRDVSTKIREALVLQLKGMKNACDSRFLDYCNCVKSLLAVYNFGNVPTAEELEASNAPAKDVNAWSANFESDKSLILEGVQNILMHVKKIGFDLTPYLDADDCMQIFGSDDGTKIETPITIAAATVITTLVYFRRACKRKNLFAESELKATKAGLGLIDESATSLSDCVAQAVAQILYYFADFIVSGNENRRFGGWGFTLDPKVTQAVTLNDTYAVVDAISRFDDAFNQDDENKRDQEFLDKVNAYGSQLGFRSLVTYSVNSIFRTAYNIYSRDKSRLYGKSLFYVTDSKVDSEVRYTYNPITYEQIASSNRSSALFNPLYVAMITMYGYNEKEIVIRRFMDDYALAKQYYDTYEPHLNEKGEMTSLPYGVKKSLSEYSQELKWFKGRNFAEEAQTIVREHPPKTGIHGSGGEWSKYYDIARVFQKYLETQLPGELMKIEEYRDYLNATKDAIDQVQIAYRKFDDSQRLGIVDTDYIMFSVLDLNTDAVTVSKLNKANISANYLRPLLLSSKIMIVNALTKYPQSDMGDLYAAIKATRHRKVGKNKNARNVDAGDPDRNSEWLWNEDTVDMNSTARHCETIMYDYFDYYEKYELSYKAISNVKKYYGKLIDDEKVNADGSLNIEKLFADGNMSDFKHIVLDLTRKNVDRIQEIYTERIKKLNEVNLDLQKDAEKQKAEHENELQKERQKHAAELEKLRVSIDIGNTVRDWIRQEADRHLKEMLSYMILNNMNGRQIPKTGFSVANMMSGRDFDEIVAAEFAEPKALSQEIMQAYKMDADAAENAFGGKLEASVLMQSLFEGALDDVLKGDDVKSTVRNERLNLDEKNAEIQEKYNQQKRQRRAGQYCADDGKKNEEKKGETQSDESPKE